MISRQTRGWCAVALALAACGGATNAATTTPTESESPVATASTEETPVPTPPQPWGSMSAEARGAWMANEVVPRMSTLFRAYDGERYADGVTCSTCHGPDPRARGFEMPSPSLPALHPTGTPEQQQMVRDHPEMVRFMFNRVLPTMQTLLGAPAYDEQTEQGFSCYACHPHAE